MSANIQVKNLSTLILYFDETKYGDIEPKPGREAQLTEMEKNRKQFKIVKLESPSWTIDVPVRK